MRGRFITFEGGEGTGKSTHAALLASRIKSFGIGTLLTREPGGSPGAEVMRYILLSGAVQQLGANAEALVFAAARDDHLTTLIRPALEQGKWVVCDRFADSTMAYQGYGQGADRAQIAAEQGTGPVAQIEGISAGGMPTRVKCLHALAAQALASGPGVNPLGDEVVAELGEFWTNPCHPEHVAPERPAAPQKTR